MTSRVRGGAGVRVGLGQQEGGHEAAGNSVVCHGAEGPIGATLAWVSARRLTPALLVDGRATVRDCFART